jgi:alkanesulfonate monooxygenase SsuD/methylene tetrahydromethanopterin reductase-like flavin-dependent oxidoreductase (luciferase family)
LLLLYSNGKYLHCVQLCLEVWGTEYEKIKATCIRAEKLGFYGFYYGESLADIDLDCWTIISALVPQTNRIKLGPVITYLLPQYRSIALLAKQAVTFQELSNGRLEFRAGAGAALQYATRWWYPYGIEYPREAERVSILNEGLQLLQMLWDNRNKSSLHFNGKYFKINGAIVKKATNSIPITVAAKKNRMMKIAVKYADVWESSYITPSQFSSLNAEFENILKEMSSDHNNNNKNRKDITKSIELDVIIAESHSELEYKKRIFAMERGPGVYNQILTHGLVGRPDTIAQRINEYTDAGVDQFFLAFQDPLDLKALDLFMDAVKS